MTELTLTWKNAGTLGAIKQIDDPCAVYVWIFIGNPKRIIYVGTSITRNQRWKDERNQLLFGAGTIFRTNKSDDIYKLMRYNNKADYITLASPKHPALPLLWVPTYPLKTPRQNDLNEKNIFDDEWKRFAEDYIKNIEIWYSSVPTKDKAKMAETLIQHRVSGKHMIGYYTDRQPSWLGRPSQKVAEPCVIISQGLPDDLSADFAN